MPIFAAIFVSPTALQRVPRSEREFQEHQIEPAPEFKSHLVEVSYLLEAQVPVQPDGNCVVRVDSRDHHMLLHRLRASNQLEHQRAAQPKAASIRPNMDAMFHGVPITGPRAELTESPESTDAPAGL